MVALRRFEFRGQTRSMASLRSQGPKPYMLVHYTTALQESNGKSYSYLYIFREFLTFIISVVLRYL